MQKIKYFFKGLKTYFVVGRTPTAKNFNENSLMNVCNTPSGGSKQNLMKVGSPDMPFTARLKEDLRHIDSSEIEYEIDRLESTKETSKLTSGLNVRNFFIFLFLAFLILSFFYFLSIFFLYFLYFTFFLFFVIFYFLLRVIYC